MVQLSVGHQAKMHTSQNFETGPCLAHTIAQDSSNFEGEPEEPLKSGHDKLPMDEYNLETPPKEDTLEHQFKCTNNFLDWLLSLYNRNEMQEGASLEDTYPCNKAPPASHGVGGKKSPPSKAKPVLDSDSESKHPGNHHLRGATCEVPPAPHGDGSKKCPSNEVPPVPPGDGGKKCPGNEAPYKND